MKKFLFKVILVGYGVNADYAWDDATKGIDLNCDPTPDDDMIEEVEYEQED